MQGYMSGSMGWKLKRLKLSEQTSKCRMCFNTTSVRWMYSSEFGELIKKNDIKVCDKCARRELPLQYKELK